MLSEELIPFITDACLPEDFVEIVFAKAMINPKLYAKLCHKLSKIQPVCSSILMTFQGFKRSLLKKCENEFNNLFNHVDKVKHEDDIIEGLSTTEKAKKKHEMSQCK